jgi:hypothetical protein
MSLPVDDLIGRLGADLRPVRRLPVPAARAGLWLVAMLAVAAVLGSFARLDAVSHRLMTIPDLGAAALGSTLTATLAALATFELSVPGRRPAWALLPLPGLALWIGASGLGCLRSLVLPDMQPPDMVETGHCFTFIVGLSIPLSALTVLMIRRACPLRPNLTAATGGLAVAAAAATLRNQFHPYDAGAADMLVHLAAVVAVVLLNRMLGGWLLDPAVSSARR